MLFSQNRNEIRQVYLTAWHKHNQAQALEPIEQIIVNVIQQHSEYHALLNDRERALSKDYPPEGGIVNPFLHMGMHIALTEQLTTNRPKGITASYQALLKQQQDVHQVEHQLMDCLGEMIWTAQKLNQPPDDKVYLKCIRKLLKNK